MTFRFQKSYKKIALLLSLCALIVWALLGTGASLAWFTDTSEELTNIFHAADFELTVSHRLSDGRWETVDSNTALFDEDALYEPGYTQVVYLRVENTGTMPFDFHTAVSVVDYTVATNMFGRHFHLQDYLLFGVAVAETESAMDAAVSTRAQACAIATEKLSNYATDTAQLAADDTAYIALVVHIPPGVANEANYRGQTVPKVELGIIVKADQIAQ